MDEQQREPSFSPEFTNQVLDDAIDSLAKTGEFRGGTLDNMSQEQAQAYIHRFIDAMKLRKAWLAASRPKKVS